MKMIEEMRAAGFDVANPPEGQASTVIQFNEPFWYCPRESRDRSMSEIVSSLTLASRAGGRKAPHYHLSFRGPRNERSALPYYIFTEAQKNALVDAQARYTAAVEAKRVAHEDFLEILGDYL